MLKLHYQLSKPLEFSQTS